MCIQLWNRDLGPEVILLECRNESMQYSLWNGDILQYSYGLWNGDLGPEVILLECRNESMQYSLWNGDILGFGMQESSYWSGVAGKQNF